MKKILAFTLALGMLCTGCSAGHEGNSTVSVSGESQPDGSEKPMKAAQTQYKETDMTVPDDFAGRQLLYSYNGVRLLYNSRDGKRVIQMYGDDMAPGDKIMLREPEDKRSSYSTDIYPCASADGVLTILYQHIIYDGDITDTERYLSEAEPVFVLRRYSPDGELLSEAEIENPGEFFTYGEDFISTITPYGSNYILAIHDALVLLSPEGEVLDITNITDNWYFCTDSEGRTVAASNEAWGYMDGETLKLPAETKEYGKWLSNHGVPFTGTGDYTAFLTLNEGFYGVDAEGRLTELMDFSDSDYVPPFVGMTVSDGADGFVTLYDDFNTGAGMRFSHLTPRPVGYVDERKPVKVGCINWDNNARDTVAMYNKQSEEYTAEIRTYEEYDDLKLDVVSGDAPDLFCYQPSSVMYRYARLGAFTDLYQLLDSKDGLSREDIVPNIMKAYEYKGALYGLPVAYHLDCWTANREVIPREYSNWNLEEFFSFAENLPENMYLGSKNSPFMDPELCFINLFPAAMRSFIDYDSFTCTFDSPEFVHLLTFCKDAKMQGRIDWDGLSQEETEAAYNEERYALLNKTALLDHGFLHSPEDLVIGSSNWGLYINDDFNYVIYPNNDRSGTVFTGNCMCYSILNGCNEPDGAWDYFCYINSQKYLESYLQVENCFVSNKKENQKRLDDAFYWAEQMEWNEDGQHDSPKSGGNWADSIETKKYSMPPETKQYILDFLSTFDKLGDSDEPVFNIAKEEADRFFAGESSAEDCAAMIQNRVSLYLSENS